MPIQGTKKVLKKAIKLSMRNLYYWLSWDKTTHNISLLKLVNGKMKRQYFRTSISNSKTESVSFLWQRNRVSKPWVKLQSTIRVYLWNDLMIILLT